MTRSTSTVAPPAMASSPPWASSRSPGTTALTQVGARGARAPVPGVGVGYTGSSMAGAGLSLRQRVLCHPGGPTVPGCCFTW